MSAEGAEASFFTLEDDVFHGLAPARGPWAREHCHAGPVAGLIARAAELCVGSDKLLLRLTIDLTKACPMDGFRVTGETTREGRKVTTARVVLTDLAGRVCATASSMHVAPKDVGAVTTAPVDPPRLEDATPGHFSIGTSHHTDPFFFDFVEVRYPPGHGPKPGPTTMWMRTLPLLPDETPSPFQSLCALADCGNGISRNAELSEMGFINTDLTIHAHRMPVSDWLCSVAHSHWHGNGVGLAHAVLHDAHGPVATALQTLILNRAG